MDFVHYDDDRNLYHNPLLNPVTPQSLAAFWTRPYTEVYRPLVYTVWAMIATVTRLPQPVPVSPFPETTTLNAAAFHVVGLLLHLATVFAVFGLLRRIVRNNTAACIGALVFAVHPLQVEAVSWVSAMNYPLGGFWAVLALYLYVGSAADATRKRRLSYAGATVCYLLALTALPLTAGLPLTALALDYWVVQRGLRPALKALIPWLLLAALWVFVTSHALGASVIMPSEVTSVPVWVRPFVAGDAITFYLTKTVTPVSLCVEYSRTPGYIQEHPATWLALLVPIGLSFLCWRIVRDPLYKTAWAVFVAGFVPVLGFVPFEFQRHSTVADRYAYLAMLGVALLAARLIATKSASRRILLACGVAIAVFSCLTILQTFNWYNTLGMFNHAAEVNPDSFPVWNNIAAARLTQGRPDLAIEPLQKALALNPEALDAHQNLALALNRVGRHDEALAEIRLVLSRIPDDPQAKSIFDNLRKHQSEKP